MVVLIKRATYLRLIFGNSLRNLIRWEVTLFPAITNVTATMMMMSPNHSRGEMISSNTVMPINMAVTGSNAPNMAVGVEPMYLMAAVVQTRDTVVGRIASIRRLSQELSWVGICKPSFKIVLIAMIIQPKMRT